MERLRLFNREVKVSVQTDQEVWDLHVAVAHRLAEANSPARLLMAQEDYEKTFALCVERGLLIDPWGDY